MTRYRLRIRPDPDPGNPRTEFDNVGKMVCWHGRYTLGDEQPRMRPDEYKREHQIYDADHLILPIFMYDHSGITISTAPFSCPWDSGQVGFIYAKRGAEGMTDGQLERCLKGEVDTYDAFIGGEIYGFELEKAVPFTKTRADGKVVHGVDWEHEDSCWGFYRDPRDSLRDHLPDEAYDLIDEAYGSIGDWAEQPEPEEVE